MSFNTRYSFFGACALVCLLVTSLQAEERHITIKHPVDMTKTLYCNDINPASDVFGQATAFSGDIKVQDSRIFGQVPSTYFPIDSITPFMYVHFNETSSSEHTSSLGLGAHINFKVHGLAHGYEGENEAWFDFYTEFSVLVGPGWNYQNDICNDSFTKCDEGHSLSIQYGHRLHSTLPGLEAHFITNHHDHSVVGIGLNVLSLRSESVVVDSVTADIYYDIVSNNVSSISLPEDY